MIGHDAGDAALAKRVRQLRDEGHEVRVLAFRRTDAVPPLADLDLGRTRDGAFAQRLAAMAGAVPKLAREVVRPDALWARNLDAAAAARTALALSGAQTPLIYECLDVHALASGTGAASAAVRSLERSVLDRAALLVVSSPAFLSRHFVPRYGERPAAVVENRLARAGLPPRPGQAVRTSPLTVGWFGVLRCARSLDLLLGAADRMAGGLRVVTAGRPAPGPLQGFAERLAASPHAAHEGPYEAPEGLAHLYGGADLAWAGDWLQDGANSRWLLPNRLYEAGWFGVPVLAPAGTETARWVRDHGTGWVLDDASPEGLAAFLSSLSRTEVEDRAARVLAASDALFAAPPGEVTALLKRALC